MASGVLPRQHPGRTDLASGRPAAMRTMRGSAAPSIFVFISLFLLLLVFFIVLTVHSRPGEERTTAVLGSVERQFAGPDAAVVAGRSDRPSTAEWQAAVGGLSGIGDLLESELAITPIATVALGSVLVATVPADYLFVPASAAVRPARRGLIDRIVDALRTPVGRWVYHFEALVAVSGPDVIGVRSIPRAAHFAEILISAGAPPVAVSIGIEGGEPGYVRLIFTLVPVDDHGGP